MKPNEKKPGNYLIFDGGRTALPQLYLIEELCARLQFDQDSEEEIRICDHCDLLGGSGPGAVAAILLGRMGLTPSQAINAYLKLESALSVLPTKDEDERQRNTDAFKQAFTEVLEEAGLTSGTPMLDKTAPKTVIWTLSAANLLVPQLIRSYRVRCAPGPPLTILEAACASVASPNRFFPVTIGTGHKKVVLVDAMVGYANPTKELLKEAQGLFGDKAEVASIVSLGAGKEGVLSISGIVDEDALADAFRRAALDSERTHEEMHDRLQQLSIYFRFNVERGLERQMDSPSVYEHTMSYMKVGVINKMLDNAVKSIKNRPKGSSLSDINSVTAVEIMMKPRPSLVDNFVGREDILDALRTTHFSSRSPELRKPAVSVLMGLGGSGKTQIALKFALEYEGRDHDASVYFFNAASGDKLKADFELAIRARDSASRSKSHDDALIWFANRKDPWLIIMDNADDPSVDLFDFIPKSSHGNLIITTRNATYKTLAPSSSHQVEGLASSDAVELILKGGSYRDSEENKAHARSIAEAVGHLPLALAHAAGYISVHRCLSTYLAMFRSSQDKFLTSKPTLPQDYKSTIAATIDISLKSIPQVARDVLLLLSRFDVSSIPQSIIIKSAERQFRYIDRRSEEEVLDLQTIGQANTLVAIFCPRGKWLESEFNEIVEQCLQYSLLRVTTQGEARFYSTHVLVQAYLQSNSASIQGYRIEKLMVRLLGSAITVDYEHKSFTFNRLLVPHLKLIALDHVTEAGDHFGFGQVLLEQGSARRSSEHFERCLALRRSSLGEEHPNTVVVMNHLASSYRGLGMHREASELQVEVLDLGKRLWGDEHPDTVSAMGNLASCYGDLGRYREALELELKVLDLRKRVSGDEHPHTMSAMVNLASSYRNLGMYRETLELSVKVLDMRKRLSGKEHPSTLHTMANLAASYGDLGSHKEALELRVEVLDLWKRLLGDEHPHTVTAMGNLASSYRDLGRHQEALELGLEVLDLRKRVSGDEHPETVLAMGNLASFYRDLGKGREALDLGVEVLDLRKRVSGDKHPSTVRAMANLASSYQDLGRHSEALELREKVLEMYKELLGEEHPQTIWSMWHLSVTLHTLGEKERALVLLQAAVPLQENHLGSDHPVTINMKGWLDSFLDTSQ